MQSAVKDRTGPLAVDVGGMTLYNVGIENKALLLFYDTGIPNCSNRFCLALNSKKISHSFCN